MNISDKKEAFEYIVFKLIEWYSEKKNIPDFSAFKKNNDFSKLKLIKLHFFVCSADEHGVLIGNIFKFSAMPYGHVDTDVYNFITELSRFTVTSSNLEIKTEFANKFQLESSFLNFKSINTKLVDYIDNAIDNLIEENPDFILYTASQLVDLSHAWASWKSMYHYAEMNGRRKEDIPPELILEENKFYYV
ncbi:MAG: hypothetical protein V4642_13120 [Bacteroidota bacterium]